MRSVIEKAAAALAAVALLASPAFAADSCRRGCPKPPENARTVSAQTIPLPLFAGHMLTATLAKGARKRILYADGLLTDVPYGGGTSRAYVLGATVNGFWMQPQVIGNLGVAVECGPEVLFCTVTGQWWLDLDEPANSALLGVPLNVALVAGDFFNRAVGHPVNVSLRVRLEKK